MPEEFKANVRQRRIGRELRKWRDRAGLKNAEVAKLLKWSPSKISKIESAAQPVQGIEVLGLALIYDVPEDERNGLYEATSTAQDPGWWQEYGTDVLFTAAQDFVELESEAAAERTFVADLIPGLLQIEDYAKALGDTFLPRVNGETTDLRAQVRARRQERLRCEEALRAEAVIWEPALHQGVGGPMIMRQQIRHLIELCAQDNVVIQVVQTGTGTYPGMGSSFTMLSFAERHFGDVVYLDSLTRSICMEEPDEVGAYSMTFEALQKVALDQEASVTLMGAIADDLSD